MRLDIVIPAFNEEARIDRTLRVYRAGVTAPGVRFLVALDSCTDGTADVVRRHVAADRRVSLLEFPKLGKGGVIMEAFRRCDAELVGFVDADGATPPAEFLRLADMTSTADGAIASRAHPASVLPARRPPGRQVSSWVFAHLTRALFGLPYLDTQCGAKVVRKQVVDRALPLLSSRDFLFDVDLLVTARHLGYRIVEVPTVWCDQEGSHLAVAAEARRMAMSSLRLWLHHRVLPVPQARPVGNGRRAPATPALGPTSGPRQVPLPFAWPSPSWSLPPMPLPPPVATGSRAPSDLPASARSAA